ncbi:MAG: ABA4-like family protein, partial [Candidatus Poseidoniaceae archaeon]|nr:ABA4-like family protein [Candidatus Poseidoniaceae archaeon]
MDSIAVAMFWISSILIIPFWSLMWFMPQHELTRRFVGDIRWSVLPLLIPYVILALPNAPNILITFASQMPTPEIVVDLFQDDEVIVLGWLHFLAFDLFIGRYVWLRMLSTKRPIYVSTPILILCTLMAPLGFLLGLLATWQHNQVERDSVMN